MTLHPMQERVAPGPAIAAGLLIFFLTVLILGLVLFEFLPPFGWCNDHPFRAAISWLVPYVWGQLGVDWTYSPGSEVISRLTSFPVVLWTDNVAAFDLSKAYEVRIFAVLIVAAIAGITAGTKFRVLQEPQDTLTHLSGRRLWRGYSAVLMLRRVLAPAIKLSGCGMSLAPGIVLDRNCEVQHTGLVGTTGSGKSTILRYFIEQLLIRRDKLIIHDTKGDMLSGLPTDDFILLAPHDRRSHAWDVARDIVSTQDARELATRFTPESHDPTWSSAAREVSTGIVVTLQRTKPLKWSWRDLADIAFQPVVELRDQLSEFYPPASRYIEVSSEGTPTRTTHSILITLWASIVGIVFPLADAWGAAEPERRLSLSEWIMDDAGKLPRTLIVQRSPRHPVLSAAWTGSVVDSISSIVAGPGLPDSDRRRIWLLLDEFAQLGKLGLFQQALEVGRSKGVACILALQDINQLSALYGEAAAQTILTLLGIKIIGKVPAGPSATTIVRDIIGEREVTWRDCVVSSSDGKTTRSCQTQRATIPVVTQDQLERRLGADGRGVRALVIAFGDVFELRWPLLFWPKRRSPTEPAEWVSR